jgi:hypothetical protein
MTNKDISTNKIETFCNDRGYTESIHTICLAHFITDIMHYCNTKNINMQDIMDIAQKHYDIETIVDA